MNFDQLIQNADPAADITIPRHDSPLARQSFENALAGKPRRKPARQRRFVVPFSATAVTAVGAGVALLVTGTSGVPVPTAAAAVLHQAAAAAARQQPVVLHHGEYLYTETRTLQTVSGYENHKNYDAEYVAMDQRWQTQQGAGKEIFTVVSPVTFANGTRPSWIEAGRPRVTPSHNPSVVFMKVKPPIRIPVHIPGKPGKHFMLGQSGDSAIPLENQSHLPTDPAALASAIQHKTTGLTSASNVEDPSTPAGAFWAAMDILSAQSVGSSPALRSALFKVMAEQPGIRNLGATHTRSGRAGVGLQVTAGHDIVLKVIVDPATGQILESETISRGAVTGWTEYLSTGVVNKIGQLPRS